MLNTNEGRNIRPGGMNRPDTCRIRLTWWLAPTTAANISWGTSPPHYQEISIEVLGVWTTRGKRFIVHAVLPEERLPKINKSSRGLFLKAVRDALSYSLEVTIEGLKADIVDWEGPDIEP